MLPGPQTPQAWVDTARMSEVALGQLRSSLALLACPGVRDCPASVAIIRDSVAISLATLRDLAALAAEVEAALAVPAPGRGRAAA